MSSLFLNDFLLCMYQEYNIVVVVVVPYKTFHVLLNLTTVKQSSLSLYHLNTETLAKLVTFITVLVAIHV